MANRKKRNASAVFDDEFSTDADSEVDASTLERIKALEKEISIRDQRIAEIERKQVPQTLCYFIL
jgi:hypothetical protein